MNSEQLWQTALGELELLVSKVHFTTWLKNTCIVEWLDRRVVVAVPNNFTKAWLENKFHKAIVKVLQNVTENQIETVEYRVETGKKVDAITQPSPAEPGAKILSGAGALFIKETLAPAREAVYGLNPRNLFSNFIVGKGNQLAHAAALRVAREPGVRYNPLFIYGGVGLGKTHLMQAVGNELARDSSFKALYATGEQFTNDYVAALRAGTIDKFKTKYRTVDLFLVDDVQFIGGKDKSQEEFFHTFNVLRDTNKQIVLTSDRPPKAIPELEERLISRFEWGMIADIANPDLETRMAILATKGQERGVALAPEIVRFIATAIQSNIRELEGALNKLMAYCELNRAEPNMELARSVVASLVGSQKRGGLTSRELVKIVSEYFDITLDELTGQSRRKELVVPRQITMFLMREELDASYPAIGHELGGRDHTTAMHAYAKIKRDSEEDERIRQDINFIRQRLYK